MLPHDGVRRIDEVAEELGVPSPHVLPYGRGRAKVALDALSAFGSGPVESP